MAPVWTRSGVTPHTLIWAELKPIWRLQMLKPIAQALLAVVAASLLISISGCEGETGNEASETAREAPETGAQSDAAEQPAEIREGEAEPYTGETPAPATELTAYKVDARGRLDGLRSSLSELEDRAMALSGEARDRASQTIADLREQVAALAARVESLSSEADQNWEEIRVALDVSFENIESSIESALQRFDPGGSMLPQVGPGGDSGGSE